jgi:allophanate hydrolase
MVQERAAKARPLAAEDSLDIGSLRARYEAGTLTPETLVEGLLERIAARGDDKVWIHLLPAEELRAIARRLTAEGPRGRPLYGIPFGIKDNIDLAGHPTTAACPEFSYDAKENGPVVAQLLAAGAIPLGKTNLDQFATGLVGMRSPYGPCRNVFNPDYISGGSSSGSAVAVAAGLASFALGTDTAGSGRVPAAFGNIVGVKPTRGLLSNRGAVPACRSLDCISILALTADDAREVLRVAKSFDAADPFSRHEPHAHSVPHALAGCRVGVPRSDELAFFGNEEGARLFDDATARLERLGARLVEVNIAPFLETARLLYEGPWVAERYTVIRELLSRNPEAVHPVTRQVIGGGGKLTAEETFLAYYRLRALRQTIAPVWNAIDMLVTPTAPRCYSIAEVRDAPIRLNSNLGYYTNYVNLLDLSAIAVPAGFQADGLPFGITMLARAFEDEALIDLGDAFHRDLHLTMGATGHALPARRPQPAAGGAPTGFVQVAVCGAHMAGLPLNHQLTERQGRLLRRCRTAPAYRLYALPGGPPERPGLLRDADGAAIEVEIWELPVERFGGFVASIPPPLGIGTIELEDGEQVRGFLCEAYAVADAEDITASGGWRRYKSERSGEDRPRHAKEEMRRVET